MRRTRIFIYVLITVIAVDCFSQEILQTDSTGNILGGDRNDWSFDRENYEKKVLSIVIFYPIVKYTVSIPAVPAFTCELNDQGVLIKWSTFEETNLKEFYLERARVYMDSISNEWEYIGYVKAINSGKIIEYEILDREVVEYKLYCYRLKAEYNDGRHEFYYSPAVNVYPDMESELYPVYPNPVKDVFSIRFYINTNDIVTLYFIKGNQRFNIMKKEDQERGFYEIDLSKNKFPFNNETVRLYMECSSCGDGKYYGDVEFK